MVLVANVGRPVEAGEHVAMLGGKTHRYRLRRSARRTLAITVEPGGTLVVTAPEGASLAQVETALRRRREWIKRRTREVTTLPPPPPPREWVNGEAHRYLGRQYRLRITTGAQVAVRLSGRWFLVVVPRPEEPARVRQAMQSWYLKHAREVFARRLEDLVRRTSLLALAEVPPLIVRRLEKRWGSCSANGRILMNVDAVKLPVGCVDYLLLHELCHLREPHHRAPFWRLLDACMPDWERWRRRLDEAEV
jgi:predicted metal-dependent hydrolase